MGGVGVDMGERTQRRGEESKLPVCTSAQEIKSKSPQAPPLPLLTAHTPKAWPGNVPFLEYYLGMHRARSHAVPLPQP